MKKNAFMLFILNITFCCSSVSWPRSKRNSDTEFDYSSARIPISGDILLFCQLLDHLNPKLGHWNQRYAVNAQFYKKTGPVFLVVHGERPVDYGYEFPYHVLAYAKHLNAIVFTLEHRFYGRTQPVNGSLVHHLSTAQALADIANFIKGMPKEFHLPKDTKWIVFGCSYGGKLAAWSRLKYPHLIHGAVASGAPLLSKVDYYEYEQIVEKSLDSYDLRCVPNIMIAFELLKYVADSPRHRIKLSQMFYLDDYGTFDDIETIKAVIINVMVRIISDAVQYNDIRRISIPVVCRCMIEYKSKGTQLQALAELRKMDTECKHDGKMQSEKNQKVQNSEKDYERARQEVWRYQRCSEFGYFSSYINTAFLFEVKDFLVPIETDIERSCTPFFGPNFSIQNLTEKINHINSQYGGLDFNIDRTIFINGSLDPWYKLSLYMKSNGSLYETIFIKGTSHCADIYPATLSDTPELRNARNKVFETLQSWLKTKST